MDRLRLERLEALLHLLVGADRQLDLRVGRQREGRELVGADHLDRVAHLPQLGDDARQSAHDAVHLGLPGVGGQQDAHQAVRGSVSSPSVSVSRARLIMDQERRLRPLQNLQPAVEVLDQRGAAFHPVAVVDVGDVADLAHLGLVDMAADHPVDAAPARLVGDGDLVVLDELQGVLHLDLQEGREAPVAEAQAAAHGVEERVEHQHGAVGDSRPAPPATWRIAPRRRTRRHASPGSGGRRRSRGWRPWPPPRRRSGRRRSRAPPRRGCRGCR